MKKIISIILTLSFCISLAACGSSQQSTSNDNTAVSSNTAEGESSMESVTETPADASYTLPVNYGDVYSCSLDGIEGCISVYSYDIQPDTMNPGCELRTANVFALFENAPADFTINAATFPADGVMPQSIDPGVWLADTASGQDIIFEYDNATVYEVNDNGSYMCELLICYVVPQDYDQLSFALTTASSPVSLAEKSSVLSESTRWFTMGSIRDGVLTSNGSAINVADADLDRSLLDSYSLSGSSGYIQSEEYIPEYAAPESPLESSRNLVLNYSNARTSASESGMTNEFESIVMTECTDSSYTVSVRVKYSGAPESTPLRAGLYDSSLSELDIETQETVVSGSGTEEFIFYIDANSTVPPYTFTASLIVNGLPRDMTIYIDGDIQ